MIPNFYAVLHVPEKNCWMVWFQIYRNDMACYDLYFVEED